MTINALTTDRHAVGRNTFAKLKGMFRPAREREAEAIIARYAHGRLSDSAEREMTEKLLHLGDTFRF